MKFVRKATSLVATFALLLLGISVAEADQYEKPAASTILNGTTLITIEERAFSHSIRKGLTLIDGVGYDESFACETFLEDREVCNLATPDMQFSAFNVLPVCESLDQENCIESVTFTDTTTGRSSTGTVLPLVEGVSYPAVPEINLHYGASAAGLWRVEGFANSAGSETYAVQVFERQNATSRTRRFETSEVNISVVPYYTKFGSYPKREVGESLDVVGKTQVFEMGPGEDCVWFQEGECGKRAAFSGSPEISVVVRYSKEVNGWFRGRLTETQVAVEDFSTSNYRVTVSGKPVEVPRFAVYASRDNTPKIIEDMLPYGSGGSGQLYEAGSQKGAFAMDGFSNRPYDILEAYRETVNDSAFGVSSLWSIESFSLYENQECFQTADGLIGIVTTNSTAFEGTEPSFDSGYLSYKVAGLHYAPDGETVNEGRYDLVMRSDVARCLYGFKNAPVSATVSVVGEMGEEKVATTIVSEDDGWLRLAAYGFTFSEKEIQVQIKQSQMKTLNPFMGSRTSLTTAQKAEIRAVLAKSDGNTKFICTGIRYYQQPMSVNVMVRKRAKEACDYAKSINPNFSYWYQTKPTKARSYAGKVLIVTKG